MSNFEYKKSLGQNFLQDQNIINKIASSLTPSKNDLIIEIGPGAGALTKELVKKECDVICFEIDKRLLSTHLLKLAAISVLLIPKLDPNPLTENISLKFK